MFEPFKISSDREKDYAQLISALSHLLLGETNLIAALSNSSALLNWYHQDINWIGFYLFNEVENQLVLGPFQGLPACVRIPVGRGVCGKAFRDAETQLIDDVLAFPGHIACDSASRSELVVPIIKDDRVLAVLDIDSPSISHFDSLDAKWMEKAAEIISCSF